MLRRQAAPSGHVPARGAPRPRQGATLMRDRRVADSPEVPAVTCSMTADATSAGADAAVQPRSSGPRCRGATGATRPGRRFGWGVADQAMSSLTNFGGQPLRGPGARGRAVRRVQPRLRDLRVRAQRLARPGHRPAAGPVQRRRPADWRRAVANCTGTALAWAWCPASCALVAAIAAGRHGPAGLPRARADAARPAAAGQLAVRVLRPRARQPGVPQRPDLGAGHGARR